MVGLQLLLFTDGETSEVRIIFRRDAWLTRQQIAAILDKIEEGLNKSGEDVAQALEALAKVRKSRLRSRLFVRDFLEEAEASGVVVEKQEINWEAIGDFIVKIAPVIMEILMLFLGSV